MVQMRCPEINMCFCDVPSGAGSEVEMWPLQAPLFHITAWGSVLLLGMSLVVPVVKNLLSNAGDSGSIPGFPGRSSGKGSACNAGDPGLIPGSGRSSGGGHGCPLQYSCLKNPVDRGACRATVHGVAKESDTTAATGSVPGRGTKNPTCHGATKPMPQPEQPLSHNKDLCATTKT